MSKTIIIAEIGINHNGSLDIAKELITKAKECGCDAVKFQKRTIDLVYSKDELDVYRDSPWGTSNREQKEGLEFSKNEYDQIDRYCTKLNIPWFASAWDTESQDFLKQYNLPYNKVASAMITDLELVTMIVKEQKYTFISTGMSNLNQIDNIVEIFKTHNCPFELMHCNSSYPMHPDQANLQCIDLLKERYKCNIGYSGHETGIIISVAAVAMGATSIERHITLDRSMYGSDQAASLEIVGLKKLCEYIRTTEKAKGKKEKIIYPEEKKTQF